MDRQRSPFFSSSSCYDPFPSERMKFVSRQWVRRRKSSEGRRFVILASFMRLPLAAVAQPVVTTIRSVLFLTRTAPGDFCSSAAGNPGAGGEPRRSSSDVPAARREEVGACADRTFSLLSLALTRSLSHLFAVASSHPSLFGPSHTISCPLYYLTPCSSTSSSDDSSYCSLRACVCWC